MPNRARARLVASSKLLVFIHLILASLTQMVHSLSHDHCYSDIGCFPLSSEFYHPRHRPFNVRPWHRRHIKTQFELFNRRHPNGFMLVAWDRRSLVSSHFNPMLETKVIVPGWLDNIDRVVWLKRLRDALLWSWAPVNIIVVRWRNFTPYTIATANSRVVGAELANLMRFLEHELGYDRAYYHVIGHSLGAHIGGYAGDRLPGLGRITALDPARPFFQGMPKSVRLDRGDAKFVDAIHSDFTPENVIFLLMSFGMTTPVGHLDFYPNGPPLFQPGCLRDSLTSIQDGIAKGLRYNSLSVAFLEATRYLTACDHQRSHEWFIESLTNRECMFVGVRCNDFEGIINGRCTCDDSRSACAVMGIHADQMYLHNVHEDVWPVRGGFGAAAAAAAMTNLQRAQTLGHSTGTRQRLNVRWPSNSEVLGHYRAESSKVSHQMQQQQQSVVPNDGSAAETHLGPLDEEDERTLIGDQKQEQEQEPETLRMAQRGNSSSTRPLTREEIYAQLKQQIDAMSQRLEPQAAALDDSLKLIVSDEQHQDGLVASASNATSVFSDQLAENSLAERRNEADAFDEQQQQAADNSEVREEEGTRFDDDNDDGADDDNDDADKPPEHFHGSDGFAHNESSPVDRQLRLALEDEAFIGYLRTNILLHKNPSDMSESTAALAAKKAAAGNNNKTSDDLSAAGSDLHGMTKRHPIDNANREWLGEPAGQFDGHPNLLSTMHRDTENWYEGTSRWYLKTNNRPNYCSNQYQLMIFLGPLSARSGRETLRANLVVSLIGSHGQLLNQRFIPRGATLSSFTMQPFFIMLEGSYSLGQVYSVSVAWEARTDPDPIQATVSFQSNPALEAVQAQMIAYKSRNYPWIPKTRQYDKSAGFRWIPKLQQMAPSGRHKRATPIAQSTSKATASDGDIKRDRKLRKRSDDENVDYAELDSELSSASNAHQGPHDYESDEDIDYIEPAELSRMRTRAATTTTATMTTPTTTTTTMTPPLEIRPNQEDKQRNVIDNPMPSATGAQTTSLLQETTANGIGMSPSDGNYRDAQSKLRQKDYIADDDSNSMLEPLLKQIPNQRKVPLNELTDEDALAQMDPHMVLQLHNLNLFTKEALYREDTIVINQVIVSPIQATYGRYGRSARTFCPPGGLGQRLAREQSIRLTPNLFGRCHTGFMPIRA